MRTNAAIALKHDPRDAEELSTSADLLPAQYYDVVARSRRGDGARNLMAAVLEDGIRCYIANVTAKSTHKRRLFDEAREWIDTRGDIAPFSFESICETFDIDPDALRRQLKTSPPKTIGKMRMPKAARPRLSPRVSAQSM
ncbi:MAG TPA: hypothetical protein VMT64_01645 [Candidatus Binataceae bacterium]|nr:hypothetical protein [Candidatus Binataceae bacterium]